MKLLRSDSPELAHCTSTARVRAIRHWPALVYGREVNAYILLLVLTAGFGLSAFARAQAGATLIVKTDMNCNWTLDGQAIGLLKAGDSRDLPVSSGEHLIRAATTDEVVAVRIKLAAVQGQKAIDIQLKSQHDQRLKNQLAETARKQSEADVALHPTWTDPDTGLMWTRKDNGSDVDWNQASDYCSKLQLAGLSDWRLPSIEELQGIYDPSVSIKSTFDYGVVNVHVKGNLKLTGWYWSSAQGDNPGKPWQTAWSVIFHHGPEERPHRLILNIGYSMRALCVRRSGE
ncbi:MAG: DUF1566 domain-containing protein [Terracidiphilus sp.]